MNKIDITECDFYFKRHGQNCCSVDTYYDEECQNNPDCYYKQRQQLKQENEELKEENYQLQKHCQICENFIDGIPCKPLRDMDYDLQDVIKQRDKAEQKLEKIREIAEIYTTIPCGDYCDSNNCEDEITDRGKTCMEKGRMLILQIIEE